MDNKRSGRKNLDHTLPPWVNPDASDFFITICCQQRRTNQLCLPDISAALLDATRYYHARRKWFPVIFLLMPDHLHMIVSFGYEDDLTKVVTAWKRSVATRCGIAWQRGFFEHRLRSNESWEEKGAYILHNPVRAGLVGHADDWPHKIILDQYSGEERR